MWLMCHHGCLCLPQCCGRGINQRAWRLWSLFFFFFCNLKNHKTTTSIDLIEPQRWDVFAPFTFLGRCLGEKHLCFLVIFFVICLSRSIALYNRTEISGIYSWPLLISLTQPTVAVWPITHWAFYSLLTCAWDRTGSEDEGWKDKELMCHGI